MNNNMVYSFQVFIYFFVNIFIIHFSSFLSIPAEFFHMKTKILTHYSCLLSNLLKYIYDPRNVTIVSFYFVILYCSGCSPKQDVDTHEIIFTAPSESKQPAKNSEMIPKDENLKPDSKASLSSIWESMPTPVMASYPSKSDPHSKHPIPSVSQMASYNNSTGMIPIVNAVWQAGNLNGLPADFDMPYPDDEYRQERNFSKSLHLRHPSEFPPFLEPGKVLVIHLPKLPPDLYILHVATTGGNEEEEQDLGFYKTEAYERRVLRIRFNDYLLWQRSLAPFHAVSRVVINPNKFLETENLITLENPGTHPLPLDAVWLSPQHPVDYPIFVALDKGEWLNRSESKWVRTVILHLAAPTTMPTQESETEESPPQKSASLPDDQIIPANHPEDFPKAWKRVQLRYSLLKELGHQDLEALNSWVRPLQDALQRGMYPVARISGDNETQASLDTAVFLFGEVISMWTLPDNKQADEWEKEIKKRVPTATVLKNRTQHNPDSSFHLETRTVWQGMDLSIREGKETALEFRSNQKARIHPFLNKQALYLRHPYQDSFRPQSVNQESSWIFSSIAEWTMLRNRAVLSQGGGPGGIYFPDGSDRTGKYWQTIRPVFRFGTPFSTPGVANLIPTDSGQRQVFSYWAVAENDSYDVQVICSTPFGNTAGKVVLELPVPWSGPTRILHHSTETHWKRGKAANQSSIEVQTEAVKIQYPGQSSAKGWVRYEFAQKGMHVLELQPMGIQGYRNINAPVSIGFGKLAKTKNLFNIEKGPPPPWWSKMELGRQSPMFWAGTEKVNLETDVPATKGGTPDWVPQIGFHNPVPKTYKAVAPLSNISSRFQFLDPGASTPQAVRMSFKQRIAQKADAVGIWVRAHRPPGFVSEFDSFNAIPSTRFYMGKLPLRQKIEIEYDSWHFISSPAHFWEDSKTEYDPTLIFWPDEDQKHQPILEVNSFAAYGLQLEEGVEKSGKCLGFARKRENGGWAFLIVGSPGKTAFWRERLEVFIDAESIQHVEDVTLRITAEHPDDPPPENVDYTMNWQEHAFLLETQIPRMPPSPTDWYRKRILEDFPLIGHQLNNPKLSAVLFNEVPESDGERP